MVALGDLAVPTGYVNLLWELKNRVRPARTDELQTANTRLIGLYWSYRQDHP